METKYTKGEWKADKQEGSWKVYANTTRNICNIQNRISLEGNSENEANAKLIAAAPELLEALRLLLDGIEAPKWKIELAINAINKATK